jgi:two-component system chemotaxis response regulator CheB
MNKRPPTLKSYLLLFGNKEHHYLLQSGVFVVCSWQQALGFFVGSDEVSIEKVGETIKAARARIGGSNARHLSEIKLIGSELTARKILPLIRSFGPVKIVAKEGPLELLFNGDLNRTRIAALSSGKKAPVPKGKIRVLIVDDSKTIRMLLKNILGQSLDIEIVGDTGDPTEVLGMIEQCRPDVITLDIHMPKMDGLTLLKKYIPAHPIPTVMITSISMEEGPTVLNALEAGAVDYIQKPEMNGIADASELIRDKVVAAASAQVSLHKVTERPKSILSGMSLDTESIIAIGASTGGTEALRVLLTQLPEEIPPILIVQHIPAGFSNAFAKRLNTLCPFEVLEAKNGDEILKNRVLIAPGGMQMRAVNRGHRWHVITEDSAPVNRHKPSVDFLFDSLVDFEFKRPVGIILTGMGGDGANGLLRLKNKGWLTIAQDKESCVVFGMPSVAIDLGAVQHVCSLNDIPHKIQQLIPRRKVA